MAAALPTATATGAAATTLRVTAPRKRAPEPDAAISCSRAASAALLSASLTPTAGSSGGRIARRATTEPAARE